MERNDFENLPVRNACHLKSEDAVRLPLRLRQMLDMAEELFGARDESYSVTGIAFWGGQSDNRFSARVRSQGNRHLAANCLEG